MRKFIFTVLVLSLVSCGKGDGSSGDGSSATVNRSPTSATITTLSDADKDTGSPTLAILGKGGLSLTAGSSVDGLFFNNMYFSAYSYDSAKEGTADSAWLRMDLGGADGRCQKNLLKKGDMVNVDFCAVEDPANAEAILDDGTVKQKAAAAFVVTPPTTSVKQGFFKVDFLVTTIVGVGVVSNDKAFISNTSSARSARENNVATKSLPFQILDKAESHIHVIYARKDWFPKAAAVTAKRISGHEFTAADIVSSDLDDNQKEIIAGLAAQLPVANLDLYKTNIVPMEPSMLDLSAYVGKGTTDGGVRAGEATAPSIVTNAPVLGSNPQPAPVAPAPMPATYSCSAYEVNDAMFSGGILPTVKAGDECAKVGAPTCPTAHTVNATVYSWASTTADTCRLSISPALQLTSTGIPLGKAKFVMEINFDQLLSSGSSLEGDSPSFEFSRVGGVPFGTNMTVTEKLK